MFACHSGASRVTTDGSSSSNSNSTCPCTTKRAAAAPAAAAPRLQPKPTCYCGEHQKARHGLGAQHRLTSGHSQPSERNADGAGGRHCQQARLDHGSQRRRSHNCHAAEGGQEGWEAGRAAPHWNGSLRASASLEWRHLTGLLRSMQQPAQPSTKQPAAAAVAAADTCLVRALASLKQDPVQCSRNQTMFTVHNRASLYNS